MLEWWYSLTIVQQIFACVAIAATVVLVIQTILLLFGLGFGTDADSSDLDSAGEMGQPDAPDFHLEGEAASHDMDAHDGLRLFTVRGIVAFFAVEGWTGLLLSRYVGNLFAVLLAFAAEKEAEQARYAREQAALEADVIVKTEIEKRKVELEAEAQAEQIRRRAQGEADAIYAKMEAEARGVQERLTRQAAGLAQIVAATGGNPNDAMKLMIADKLEELTRVQVDAVKNLKIDKVTVWDSMNGKDGSSTTSNFLSSMMKSVPPMKEMFEMAGMELPEYLGKEKETAEKVESEQKEQPEKDLQK